MTIPRIGQHIVFTRKPAGSYVTEGEIYEVESISSPETHHGHVYFRNVRTRSGTFDRLYAVDRAEWHPYSYEADRIRLEKQLDERNAANAKPPCTIIPFPNRAQQGMYRPTMVVPRERVREALDAIFNQGETPCV